MKRTFALAMMCGGLMIGSAAAQVVVTVRPPRGVRERRPMAPSRNHVWVNGYHRWDGRAYVWQPGRWELPPRPHAHWVPAHWAHRRGGWVLIEGHWR